MTGLKTGRPKRAMPMRVHDGRERAKYLLGRGARLTVEQIDEVAGLATGGLTDAGAPYHREGLEVLVDSARRADLTYGGRRYVHDMLWTSLARRRQLVAAKKRTPEVFEAPLRQPLLIMGMARTGTTHLHRLLAVDPRFHGPPQWELLEPVPPSDGPDMRRANQWEREEKRRRNANDHVHFSDPDTPEECSVLQMSQFCSGLFWAAAPLYAYTDWLINTGTTRHDDFYRDYRDFLLQIQSQHPEQALALKSPGHTVALDAIDRVVPEAMVIHMVRDPLAWSNSSHSLVYHSHSATARRMDVGRMVDTNLAMMGATLDLHLEARERLDDRVIDVYYDDLVTRPIDVVRSIYSFHGIEWIDGHEVALQKYLDEHPQNKHGKHKYSSADFGLTDDDVKRQHGDYISYFGLDGSTPRTSTPRLGGSPPSL